MSTDIRDAVARALTSVLRDERRCCVLAACRYEPCVCRDSLADAALSVARPLIEAEARERALREAIRICMPTDRSLYDSEMRAYGDHFAGMIYALLPAPATEPAAPDGWIKWDGGECPVDGGMVVQIRMRAYDERYLPIARAESFGWTHDGSYDDIIAYRIVKEPADARDDA